MIAPCTLPSYSHAFITKIDAGFKNKTIIMVENDDVTGNSEGLSKVQKLWKEVKEWRSHWKWSTFLNALDLGLAASLFDMVTTSTLLGAFLKIVAIRRTAE